MQDNHLPLCQEWLERCRDRSRLHTVAARRFYRRNQFLTFPSIVIISAVAALQFALTSGKDLADLWWLQLILALLSSAAGVLSTISSNLKYETLSQRHRNSSQQFETLADDIQLYQLQPEASRKPVDVFFQELLSNFQRARKDSPILAEFPVEEDDSHVARGLATINKETKKKRKRERHGQ